MSSLCLGRLMSNCWCGGWRRWCYWDLLMILRIFHMIFQLRLWYLNIYSFIFIFIYIFRKLIRVLLEACLRVFFLQSLMFSVLFRVDSWAFTSFCRMFSPSLSSMVDFLHWFLCYHLSLMRISISFCLLDLACVGVIFLSLTPSPNLSAP